MALTLAEIDEQLTECRNVPTDERGIIWQARVDALLAQRTALAGTDADHRETRLLHSPETR